MSSSSVRSRTRLSGSTPVAASVSRARVLPTPKMYVSATSVRLSRGRSTPTSRAMLSCPHVLPEVSALPVPPRGGPRPPSGGGPRAGARGGEEPWCGERTPHDPARGEPPDHWPGASGVCSVVRSRGAARDGAVPGAPRRRRHRASPLTLLVARVAADDHDPAVPADHPAVAADPLDARLDFHAVP